MEVPISIRKCIQARIAETRRKVRIFRGVYPVAFDVASTDMHAVNGFAVRAHQEHWMRHYRQRYMEGMPS